MAKKCEYCGEEEPTEKIANPNLDMGEDIDWSDEKSWWKVCKDCKEVIKLQMFGSIGLPVSDKLDEIAKRTGKPIMSACLQKNDNGEVESTSITYTGQRKG